MLVPLLVGTYTPHLPCCAYIEQSVHQEKEGVLLHLNEHSLLVLLAQQNLWNILITHTER